MDVNKRVDFAISYAGEDTEVAREITRRLRELGLSVFFAGESSHLLVGVEGESFFERLFTEAKQVIVLISEHYRRKEWPRFEWDIIRERDREKRFIPIRLDDTKILGLSSNILHLRFAGENYGEIVDTCVKQLLLFERDVGEHRLSEYERVLDAIQSDSRGALAKAYQLVKEGRKRSQLDDCELPAGQFQLSYEVVEADWSNYSVVKRRAMKILVPPGLSHDELRFNLKHCAASQFNACKPDAVMVLAYSKDPNGYSVDGIYTAGRAVFAPFGKWEKAEEGVAYNIPTEQFDYSIDFARTYFSAS